MATWKVGMFIGDWRLEARVTKTEARTAAQRKGGWWHVRCTLCEKTTRIVCPSLSEYQMRTDSHRLGPCRACQYLAAVGLRCCRSCGTTDPERFGGRAFECMTCEKSRERNGACRFCDRAMVAGYKGSFGQPICPYCFPHERFADLETKIKVRDLKIQRLIEGRATDRHRFYELERVSRLLRREVYRQRRDIEALTLRMRQRAPDRAEEGVPAAPVVQESRLPDPAPTKPAVRPLENAPKPLAPVERLQNDPLKPRKTPRVCQVWGCENVTKYARWCFKHRTQLRTLGYILAPARRSGCAALFGTPDSEGFEKRVPRWMCFECAQPAEVYRRGDIHLVTLEHGPCPGADRMAMRRDLAFDLTEVMR